MMWGAQHIDFHALGLTHSGMWQVSWRMVTAVFFAAVAFGCCARLFVWLSHQVPEWLAGMCKNPIVRPMVGGTLVIAMVFVLGSADYLGLGVEARHEGAVSLLSCFRSGGADTWSWWWKLWFTVITLSCGFKGGEVTPLFFIGAALGNSLAMMMGQPVELFAGLGLVAVFAAAANTPLACTILAIELFGFYYAALFALGCLMAYLSSGRHGIYKNQK
jgi:H+/Cl- antiporter ClcA